MYWIQQPVYVYMIVLRRHGSSLILVVFKSLVNISAGRKDMTSTNQNGIFNTNAIIQASKPASQQQVKLCHVKMVPSHCKGNIREAGSTPVGL